MAINQLIEFEPIDIRSIQTPELNQLFLGHPVTGDGWGEDGRIPDLLDFCKVCVQNCVFFVTSED